MKANLQKLLAPALAALLLLPCFVACGEATQDPKDTTATTVAGTVEEGETQFDPQIPTKNYDKEFNITGVYYIRDWATATEDERGDPLSDTIFERGIKIKDHLGVDLVDIDAGDWTTYSHAIKRTVSSGDDAYQLVATHCYEGVTTLLSSNAVFDFSDFETVNLDAPYWATDFMEDVKVGDKYLIGYNDFCLSVTISFVFNKALMDEYNLTYPYEDVRNQTWTMDKLMALTANVAKDNGDGVWDVKDTYGITGWGWTDTISFVTACDIKIVDRNEDGLYQVAYTKNTEKTYSALQKVNKLYHAESSHFCGPYGTNVNFAEGTALMSTVDTTYLSTLRDVTFSFGVLPYPKYDEKQADYKSLNWNGVLLVPGSIKDSKMVGDVLELLAFYTPPVKKAFYEDLLGSKIADAPEDAEMLDVIWGSVVTDIGMISANLTGMDPLLYMFPNLCMDDISGFSSYVATYSKNANRALERLYS